MSYELLPQNFEPNCQEMKAKDQAIAVRIKEMKEHSNSFWVWSIFLQLTNYTPMSLQPPEPNPVGAAGFRWKSCINLIIITLTQLPVYVCDFCVYKHNKKELPPYKLVSPYDMRYEIRIHMIWDTHSRDIFAMLKLILYWQYLSLICIVVP